MNVSITEDATMSRTRFEGGATIVRVDAIVIGAGGRADFLKYCEPRSSPVLR
jgi:hypothetical protein